MIGLPAFVIIASLLFCLGLFAVVTRRNAVAVLMGVELILNAANVNFVAFSRYVTTEIRGHVVAIFVILLAVAEAAVALAIVIAVYRTLRDITVDEVDSMRW